MEEKRLPDLCTKKDTCCGCSACVTICPVCAISMCPDEKGFLYPLVNSGKCIRNDDSKSKDADLYPLVNSGKCIRCYKCEQICPFKKR